MGAYKIPIGYWIESFINFFSDNFSFLTKAFSDLTERGIDWSVDVMMFFPPDCSFSCSPRSPMGSPENEG